MELSKILNNQIGNRSRFWKCSTASGQVELENHEYFLIHVYPNQWDLVNHKKNCRQLRYLTKIYNQSKLLVSSGYPKHKNPTHIEKWGPINQPWQSPKRLPLA